MELKSLVDPMAVLRSFQAIFAVITLGLFASVAAWYNSNSVTLSNTAPSTTVPGEVAYAVFVPVLTLLITLPYLYVAPRYFPTLAHRYAVLTIESLTQILWFASWIAAAAFLGKLSVCRGGVCVAAKLGVVIAAFEWTTWVVTCVFAWRYCTAWNKEHGDGHAKGIEEGHTDGQSGIKFKMMWLGGKVTGGQA